MRKERRVGGFTLVEMMVVVVIIGILATVAVVSYKGHTERTRREATRLSIAGLRVAVDRYEMELGEYPDSLQKLVIEGDEDWPGPFIAEEELPKDAWGNDFKYEVTGKRYRIASPGKDGRFGTDDDLWK